MQMKMERVTVRCSVVEMLFLKIDSGLRADQFPLYQVPLCVSTNGIEISALKSVIMAPNPIQCKWRALTHL